MAMSKLENKFYVESGSGMTERCGNELKCLPLPKLLTWAQSPN